jgi:hypothetical protein
MRGAHGPEGLLDEGYDAMDEDRGLFGLPPPQPGGGSGGGGAPGGGGARPKRVRGKRGWQEGAP